MTIFTAKNILKAYLDCRKTKRKTINALKYEMDLENNLEQLLKSLVERTNTPKRSICFVVTKPKVREIFAADFSDRIAHHLLVNEVQAVWDPVCHSECNEESLVDKGSFTAFRMTGGRLRMTEGIFIDDSYACRKGKGHHYAATRIANFVKQLPYYGQFDIKNFFSSINKPLLYKLFTKQIIKQTKPAWWKEEILWLAKVIIFNDPTKNYVYKGDPKLRCQVPIIKSLFNQNSDTGMPIGNLTSQFLANVYLNELDHFVTENLGCKAYGRYVDDFLLFGNSRKQLTTWRDIIRQFLLEKLCLTLHPRKQQIQPTRHGVPFVGYFIKPWGITVRRNVVKAAKNKIYHFNKSVILGNEVTPESDSGCASFHSTYQNDDCPFLSSLNSYFGHFGKAKSSHLRKHLIEKHLSPEFRASITVVGNWHHIRLRLKTTKSKSSGHT